MGFGGFERFEVGVDGCLVGYSRTMDLGLGLRSGRLFGLVDFLVLSLMVLVWLWRGVMASSARILISLLQDSRIFVFFSSRLFSLSLQKLWVRLCLGYHQTHHSTSLSPRRIPSFSAFIHGMVPSLLTYEFYLYCFGLNWTLKGLS